MSLRVEHVHPSFTKWHLNEHGEQLWPFRPTLHHFVGPEPEEAHCHPWDVTTICLRGWYDARFFQLKRSGNLHGSFVDRLSAGERRVHLAETIHRIVGTAPEGCWTWAEYGPCRRESLFYRFEPSGRVVTRPWHQPSFERA